MSEPPFQVIKNSPSQTRHAIIAYYISLGWAYSQDYSQLTHKSLMIQLNTYQAVLKKKFHTGRWHTLGTQSYRKFSPDVFTSLLEARRL